MIFYAGEKNMSMIDIFTRESRLDLSWIIVLLIFLAGFGIHCTVFFEPHREGDELIYSTLVAQLEHGKGYTLLGSSLLERGGISKEQYSGKLFHHPPGGIGLFWLFYKVFGFFGYPLVQLFSYSLFFWSMMFLGKIIGLSSTKFGPIILAGLSAFNPILSQVITNFWLDGPLLAFSTCAVSLFIWSAIRGKLPFVILAGILLGYAGLIKQTVFLIIPGLLIFTWILLKPQQPWSFIKVGMYLLVPAIIMQLPWEIWRWATLGSPFTSRAGHPLESLVNSNPYVRYVTVVRSPWIYVTLLPRIIWTIIPSILLYIVFIYDKKIRSMGFSFMVWIGTILAVHIFLGFMGYSKLIRYVILMTPPAALLISFLMNDAIFKLKNGEISSTRTSVSVVLLFIIASVAVLLEIATGIKSAVLYRYDLIIPLVGSF